MSKKLMTEEEMIAVTEDCAVDMKVAVEGFLASYIRTHAGQKAIMEAVGKTLRDGMEQVLEEGHHIERAMAVVEYAETVDDISLNPKGNPIGTSFHGSYVITTRRRLMIALGKPHYLGYTPEGLPKGDGKIRYEWYFDLGDGACGTLYDYKEPASDVDAPTSWHVGTKNEEQSKRLAEWITNRLKRVRE